MNLVSSKQIPDTSLKHYAFDVVVAASGYETRAGHFLNSLNLVNLRIRLAFGFSDRITATREENDAIFKRAGFDIIPADGDSGVQIACHVMRALKSCGREVRMLVDYTSMTRMWYAALIEMISSAAEKTRIECHFVYSPAVFIEPGDASPNSMVGPIPGFCGLDLPDKPSAVILGLGYDKERALGLLDYIDPATSYAFYTDPPLDSRYLEAVLENNHGLLAALPENRIFRYPLEDLQQTSNLLLSLYSGLRDEYRVILAPLGVKPFCLLCLLLACRFRDVDVWRVTSGTRSIPQERKPLGKLLVLRTTFEG